MLKLSICGQVGFFLEGHESIYSMWTKSLWMMVLMGNGVCPRKTLQISSTGVTAICTKCLVLTVLSKFLTRFISLLSWNRILLLHLEETWVLSGDRHHVSYKKQTYRLFHVPNWYLCFHPEVETDVHARTCICAKGKTWQSCWLLWKHIICKPSCLFVQCISRSVAEFTQNVFQTRFQHVSPSTLWALSASVHILYQQFFILAQCKPQNMFIWRSFSRQCHLLHHCDHCTH